MNLRQFSLYHRFSASKLIIFAVCIILGLVLVLLYFLSKSPPPQKTTENRPATTRTLKMPQPVFDTWTVSKDIDPQEARPQNNALVYTFDTLASNASFEQKIVSTLNIGEPKQEQEDYHYYEHTDANTGGTLLLFNTKTQEFSYYTVNLPKLTPSNPPQHPEQTIMDAIREMGYTDESITITAAYMRASTPGITYYELHRSWEKAKYPILNPIGLLNLTESQQLKDLSLQSMDSSIAKDEDIIAASDDTEGYARRDDFNTMTVAVDQASGSIISIQSNIRPTAQTKAHSSEEYITTNEAITRLQNGDYNLFLTQPSGKGTVDWNRVYSEGMAKGKEAIIDEVILAYLEKPAGTIQNTMEPYYVFKGHSDLSSGYRVLWIAAVSALINDTKVKGVHTTPTPTPWGLGTLHLSTFQPTLTPMPGQSCISIEYSLPTTNVSETTPTSIVTGVSPTVTTNVTTSAPSPTPNLVCNGVTADKLEFIIEYEGLTFGFYTKTNLLSEKKWYLIPDNTMDASFIEDILADFDRFMEKIDAFLAASDINSPLTIRPLARLRNELKNRLRLIKLGYDPVCPIAVSGFTPTQFWYGTTGTTYNMSINRTIIYSDPAITQTSTVSINDEGTIDINGHHRNYFYYEYDPVQFTKPDNGWIIKKSELVSFSQTISKKLGLNNKEQDRLLFELTHASYEIEAPYLFIGMIPQDEVDEKLPLQISPQIKNIQRIHLYVAPSENNIYNQEPVITPVPRTETIILEIGAVSYEK